MPDQKAGKPMTKTEFLTAIAQASGLEKGQISTVIDEMRKLIAENLKESGPGVVSIPGLAKVKVVRKPAVPERRGINPFTKEETTFKAKPASNVVKIQPLKQLKDSV